MFTQRHMMMMDQIMHVIQRAIAGLDDKAAQEVAALYPTWQPGTWYEQDKYITWGEDSNGDPILYKTAQGHTSSAEWEPGTAPALYTRISLDESGRPVWSQPTGAHDAYNTGDVVSHKGKLWRSKRDGNTSEPGTDEWWEIFEEV